MPGKRGNFSSPGFLLLLLLACLIAGDLIVFFILPSRFLYPSDFKAPPQQLKVAAILFGGFNPTYTGINEETKRRVNHGIEMLKRNEIEQLVVVGGSREESQRPGAQLMADYLQEAGVANRQIIVEDNSSDSLSNLEQLAGIMTEQEVNTAGLISSPYHLKRIQRIIPPQNTEFTYSPYDPAHISPPLTRKEIWWSIHYNLAAYMVHFLLPEPVYRKFVNWVRKNTE